MSYLRPPYNAADATWQGQSPYSRPAYNAADAGWAVDDVFPPILASAATPTPELLGRVQIPAISAAADTPPPAFGVFALVPAILASAGTPAPELRGALTLTGITAGAQTPGVSIYQSLTLPPITATIVAPRPVISWTPLGANYYTLTLTGEPPVLLPCANFLARLRSGRRSYLQVTIPYSAALADIISARPDEDLQLRYHDLTGEPHTVIAVALEGIQIARGVSSSSIVLTGWRQSTNPQPTTHSNILANTISSGTTAATITMPGYRPEIKPGDTVQAEGVSFPAHLVTVQAAARQNDIEITTTLTEEAIA